MKIRLTKNLDPFRAGALAHLDEFVGQQIYAQTASPIAMLRARKLAEAKRVLAGEGGAPMLKAEARAKGVRVAALAASVVEKATAGAETLATIEARRQATQAAIRSAPHPAAIEAALEEFLNG
ncbi:MULTISPECIES: hypothetical protein [Kaistia]|uniref:Uncharacterized protein n=1 Tax=Kaistia nematophila TaxID=2994654 RepID=A0A9X3E6T3_9HYPH|nr:hypothetical protein [Kaistia nematophila]MCX5570628.1 hypothetical protein [Kaistia nematophila]